MELENRQRIATAEGVDVDLVIAGFGSRFLAGMIDGLVFIVVILASAAIAGFAGVLGPAYLAVVSFGVLFAYPVIAEVLGNGRTLGKLLVGLRVVTEDGGPVGFTTSAIRNALRLVDILPGLYTVGAFAAVFTRRSQRLGDLAAGTLVVRDRLAAAPRSAGFSQAPMSAPMAQLPPDAATWDVSAVTAEELAAVRSFLDRRWTLDPAARARLGTELAVRLRSKVVGPPEQYGPEPWLEYVVAAKLGRGSQPAAFPPEPDQRRTV